jgi:signal transduction histidine kinase
VSHDLKAPLTVITGTAQLLRRRAQRADASAGAQLVEGLDEGLQRIAAAGTRITTWIQDLLDVTQLELGQPLGLNREPIDLVALAQQAAADQRQATQHHCIRVEAALPVLTAPCDAARLRRVLDNLLSNAVKYTPAGGEITVSLATHEGEGRGGRCASLSRRTGSGPRAARLPPAPGPGRCDAGRSRRAGHRARAVAPDGECPP